MIMFKTTFNQITKCEVDSVTTNTVKVNGIRQSKNTAPFGVNWHASFADAKMFLIDSNKKEVARAKRKLKIAQANLANTQNFIQVIKED